MVGNMVTITILDSIECEVSKKDAGLIEPAISFDASYWIQGRFKKIKKEYIKKIWVRTGKDWMTFYTGSLPRIIEHCKKNKIRVKIVGERLVVPQDKKPKIKGITFREDQLRLIQNCVDEGRGVISAGTGIGKTVVQAGVISCYKGYNVLLLAHTVAITGQTYQRFKEYGFKSIELFGGGNKVQKPTKQIVISTIQSFVKLDPDDYGDYFDIVIVDEVHHTGKRDSNYTKVLSKILAPNRFGFTATPPKDSEGILICEGLVGPIIGELPIDEATEMGILAKPKMVLKVAEYGFELEDARTWQQAYKHGIVENKRRNKQIVDVAIKYVDEGKPVLIFVVQIKQGEALQKMLERRLNRQVAFVQGSMKGETRKKVQAQMQKQRGRVAIATSTWTEGVDVPGLACVILADGGMGETKTLQKIGRGLRTTEDKDSVDIVDFLDLKNNHLIRHTGFRLGIYSENNWI
jgi:superfamily II DNA or RNA helicase